MGEDIYKPPLDFTYENPEVTSNRDLTIASVQDGQADLTAIWGEYNDRHIARVGVTSEGRVYINNTVFDAAKQDANGNLIYTTDDKANAINPELAKKILAAVSNFTKDGKLDACEAETARILISESFDTIAPEKSIPAVPRKQACFIG